MSVDSLLAQHVRIVNAASALEQMCAPPALASAALLARATWALVRDLLLHLDQVEAQLYARLPARAAEAAAEADALVASVGAHVARWSGGAALDAWAAHRAAVQDLTAAIRARLDREARDIVTLLPTLAPAPAGQPDRIGFAAEAVRLRAILFGLAPLPPA